MADEVSFAPVSPEDYAEAREFIVKYFYAFEPMNRAYIGQKETSKTDVEFAVKYLAQGLGVKAVDRGGKIIGLSLGYIGQENDAEVMRQEAKRNSEDRKWRDMLEFLAFVQDGADVLGKFGIEVAYEVQLVAVHPDYRGRSIGRRLIEQQIVIAKERGFRGIYVDCSNVFTAHIVKGLGFECIHEISFADYRTAEGLAIFHPEDPVHTVMRSFFKMI